jgi:hypothetical protein
LGIQYTIFYYQSSLMRQLMSILNLLLRPIIEI